MELDGGLMGKRQDGASSVRLSVTKGVVEGARAGLIRLAGPCHGWGLWGNGGSECIQLYNNNNNGKAREAFADGQLA